MQEIITDISSPRLLSASDLNMAAFWSAYGRTDWTTNHSAHDVVWFYTGIRVPLFNGVLFVDMEPDVVMTVVESLKSRIDAEGAPALWWIGPQSRPEGIGRILERCGLEPAGEAPGMAMDLASLEETMPMIEGFSVRKVHGRDMQTLWARIAAEGTGFPDTVTDAMVKIETVLTDPLYTAQYRYIGYLNGVPIATSAMVLESGVAGIYAVAVMPEARRRGIGKIMTVMPLLEAGRMGYRIGTLQSSALGYSLYGEIGFKDICRYSLYLQK